MTFQFVYRVVVIVLTNPVSTAITRRVISTVNIVRIGLATKYYMIIKRKLLQNLIQKKKNYK